VSIIYLPSHQHDDFVELTDEEYAEAVKRGKAIYRRSQRKRLRDHRAFLRNGVDGERVQMLGEVAARAIAKALDLEWTDSTDSFKNADLPHNIEARLIGRDWYGLRVYERDHGSRRVVGCVIEKGQERGEYRIPGWINAIHGKRSEWLQDFLSRGRPVYVVPQSELYDLDVLRALIERDAIVAESR